MRVDLQVCSLVLAVLHMVEVLKAVRINENSEKIGIIDLNPLSLLSIVLTNS